jgi:hypothetical protein
MTVNTDRWFFATMSLESGNTRMGVAAGSQFPNTGGISSLCDASSSISFTCSFTTNSSGVLTSKIWRASGSNEGGK